MHETVTISTITKRRWDSTKETLKIKEERVPCDDEPLPDVVIEGFNWDADLSEDKQTEMYIKYLEKHLIDGCLGSGYYLIDVSKNKSLLDLTLKSPALSFRGGFDVLVKDVRFRRYDKLGIVSSGGWRVVIELKKSVGGNHQLQAFAEIVAADILQSSDLILGLLTDLNEIWQLAWVEDKCVKTLLFKHAANALDMLKEMVLKANKEFKGKEFTFERLNLPVKRQKIMDFIPQDDLHNSIYKEELDNLELMSDMMTREEIELKRRELSYRYAHELVSSIPAYSSMYG
jgi:hypothetical protein